MQKKQEIIKISRLTKYYGKARGIVGLDLTVEEGDFFGFIGPNGAGKSTTIRTLLGLIERSSGEAQIFGKDVSEEKEAILCDIGYMPSEAIFYDGMRVKDVIKLSADLRKMNCREEAARLCERLQLDVNKKVDELSLGNRKKVAIVCAMQHKPKLYIFDEPTSGLDPLMQHEFFSLLEERNREGATIFFSSHVLSEVQRYCNRAAIVREGRLIACGTVDELAGNSARRIIISGKPDMTGLKGMRDVTETEDGLSFLFGGNINDLISVLAGNRIKDLTVSEPDLDEIFMHYYTDGNEN